MNTSYLIIILAISIVMSVYYKINTKKVNKINIVFIMLFLLTYLYFKYSNLIESYYYEVYVYLVFSFFVYMMVTMKLKNKIARDLTDFDFFELENELKNTKKESELLRRRFISTIELSNEGILFHNENNSFFGTDKFLKITNMKNNEFTIEDYKLIIHNDDLLTYQNTIKKLTKKNPFYNITYRIINQGNITWIQEKGKKIFFENTSTIISMVKGVDIKLFPETNIDELNSLPQEKNMYAVCHRLVCEKEEFYLVMIYLNNIPELNKRYGRDVGDLMIGEYIKKLKYNFAKDNSSIFRVQGIQFALVIKEQRKFEVLNRALTSGGELINLQMNFGGIDQTVYPKLGIVKYPNDSKNISQLINNANKALDVAMKSSNKNFVFFDKIS